MHRSLLALIFSVGASLLPAQPLQNPQQAQAVVNHALTTELRAIQDTTHPMRYRLAKSSPRLATVKLIAESRDGDVARLIESNHHPLSPDEAAREEARLNELLADPGRQNHRKQREEGDMGIVLKLLRMMPTAFTYQYIGEGMAGAAKVEKFSFRPNPGFHPPDMESQALTSMSGELWLEANSERVVRLEGHLQADTTYGLGMLGKLDKGGWLVLEQSEVGPHLWRISRFQIHMNLRILFKQKIFDSTQEMTGYTPIPAGIDYRQAIQMLRSSH